MIVSPGKWVSEEQLIALKGIKKGTLKVTVSFKPSFASLSCFRY